MPKTASKTYEIKITDFSRGMTPDFNEKDTRFASLIAQFDAHTYKHRLVPFRSSVSAGTDSASIQRQNFLIATDGNLYSLGVVGLADSKANIMYATNFTNNPPTWNAGGSANSGVMNPYFFVFYKQTGKIYCISGVVVRTLAISGLTWNDSEKDLTTYLQNGNALTVANVSNGLIASDDILYLGVDNVILKNNNGTWSAGTAPSLVLPSRLKVTSICEYANYLAIATAPLSGFGKSYVYLWDKTSSSWNDVIEWGEGTLQVLEELNGYLIGISYTGSNSTDLIPKIQFKYYAGSKVVLFRELVNETTFATTDFPIFKQKVNNAIYFLLKIKIGGTLHHGLWKVGWSPLGEFTIVKDRVPNNDTGVTSSATLQGFFVLGDYVFISYSDSGFNTTKTDSQANYTASGTYESVKLGDTNEDKNLKAVGVMCEALPSGGQIILKYKKDSDTSWTTIFTYTTANGLYHEATSIEGGAEFGNFREIQFQILSTGNAIITGLYMRYENVNTNPSQ